MAITYNPFESEYGFRSPSFTVDDQGNITARSITFTLAEDEESTSDFQITQSVSGQFREAELIPDNPEISLLRGSTYSFDLGLTGLTWNILVDDGSAYYDDGIKHVDSNDVTTTGRAAQNKSTGVFTFDVPVDAPETLRYASNAGVPFGTFSIADPVITGNGNFNTLNVGGNINAVGDSADIRLQPAGDGTVNISASSGSVSGLDVTATSLVSTSGQVDLRPVNANLTLIARGTGITTIDSAVTGSLNNISIGNNVPSTGAFTTLTATNIENTTIGATTPAAGNFTDVTATGAPTTETSLTNKKYVDSNVTAFAIALGT